MQQRGCDFTDVRISGCLESLHWKEGADSSGSETGKQELDDDISHDTHSSGSNVQFIVGSRCVGFSVE
jgi:ligand-binding SRPBCC domain-containing protein